MENFPQPHVGSYYAASVNHPSDYAALQGDTTADVCVVGAGLTGISTALTLSERGYKVCVLEANRVGWGASGRNGGQMIGGISGEHEIARHYGPAIADMLWQMRWAGHEIIATRVRDYRIDCDLKYGYLDVATRPRHLRGFESECEQFLKYRYGHEYRMLDRHEAAGVIGSERYIGALMNMGNGHLHPLNLCIGEARAAVSSGARIFEQSPVRRIEYADKVSVVTDHGVVRADFAVLAGNAYHDIERDLSRRVMPVNSYIIATEPLSADILATVNPRDLAICDGNYILEYFRLSADKRLLFGGRCNYFGMDPAEIERQLRPRMSRVYPQLADARVDYAWGGSIAIPIKRVPQIGRSHDNVYFAQGYSGHGVNVTHLSGQILADAIGGTFERFDVFAKIKSLPIPGRHLFGRQMVGLAMLYYRLKDLL